MEEEHDKIIEEIISSFKQKTKITAEKNFTYRIKGKPQEYQVDLLILIGFKLFIFEIKTGKKERKAKKQLDFHKKYIENNQQKIFTIYNLAFSEVNTLRVSKKEDKIINMNLKEETTFTSFLNDPLSFLIKE